MHPLLQEVIAIETVPTVTACRTLLDSLHLICLAHGLEIRRPENIIASLISVSERIVVDDGVMDEYKLESPCDKALRTAFDIRMEYAHLGLTEPHDSLQQMMNLINILLLAKDVDNAKSVLAQYEALVLEHLSDTSLDYGICKLSRGIIGMMEGKPEPAEINLLGAESIIGNAMGTDNDYMNTTYRYLNNLYAQ